LGYYHTCAVLDNATAKCWGRGQYGELGQGNTTNYGSAAGTMGDSLPAISLGTGRTAVSGTGGLYHTCILLDNSTTKCFGRANNGQTGHGNTTNTGGSAGQMGDSLAVTSLAAAANATVLQSFYYFTCAILTDSTTKCWGINTYGDLGQGNTTTRGDGAGEMGGSLAVTSLGTGRTATKIAVGQDAACALLDDKKVKCWGRGQLGQLGNASTTISLGDAAGEMGDSLAEIILTGF
jgi:alpha-tubulin suppressor-like RCC1 family protein